MEITGRMIGDITLADIRDFRDLATTVTDEAQRFEHIKTLTCIARSPGSGDDIGAMPDEECLTWGGLARALPGLLLGPRVSRLRAGRVGVVGAGTQDPLVPIIGDPDDWERGGWQGWPVGNSVYGIINAISYAELERPSVSFRPVSRRDLRLTPPGTFFWQVDDAYLAYRGHDNLMLGEYIYPYRARGAAQTLRINVPRLNDEKLANCYGSDSNGAPTFLFPEYIYDVHGDELGETQKDHLWPPGTTIEGDAGGPNGYMRRPYTVTRKYKIEEWAKNSSGGYHGWVLYSIDDVPLVQIWIPDNDWD